MNINFVVCSKCGEDLQIKQDGDKLMVEPCCKCLGEERDMGFDDGYEEGYREGERSEWKEK